MFTRQRPAKHSPNRSLWHLMPVALILAGIHIGARPAEAGVASAFSVTGLCTEYTKTPLGIDVKIPRFNWRMEVPENRRHCAQTAYRILVKDPQGTIVWDTQKVNGDLSLGLRYSGSPLRATTRYDWTVTVWDQDGQTASESSWFETGLMSPDPGRSAWDGAKWIGGGDADLVLYAHYLSVFRLRYSLQLDRGSNSTKASFVFGANDSRLLDKNMNFWGMETDKDGHYVKAELDISAVDGSETGLAKLNIYRVGYTQEDSASVPFQSFDIQNSVINQKNKYGVHHFEIANVFGQISITLDGHASFASASDREQNARRGGFGGPGRGMGGVSLNVNPVGRGGDYISFPMLADMGFSVDAGQAARFSNVAVTHHRSPRNTIFAEDLSAPAYDGIYARFAKETGSGFSVVDGAYVLSGDENGVFVVADPSRNAMPMLRTDFTTRESAIERARLYVTARGVYEMYLNGKRVGKDYFNPGLTQYNKTHLYQTYDVTDLLLTGRKNAIGAWLGQGWWSGNYTFRGNNWNFFGDRQSLLAKLVVTYRDGTVQTLTTNGRDWKVYGDGPIRYGSFFQGEAYDASREEAIEGWSTAEYNDRDWKDAVEVPLEGTAFLGGQGGGFGGRRGETQSFDYDEMSLVGQVGENAGVVRSLTAQSVNEVRPGVYVYDMGQNMVGVPKVSITSAQAGDRITLRYAEMLYPDMAEYGDNVGMIMLENIRAALAQDTWILRAGDSIIQPRFTFHGYRYVEITGIKQALPLEAVQGLVISSITKLTASYETANTRVNRLWQNIVWSQYGNFLSIPTDCPQRNERMGWSGDISVFSRTSTYLANVDQFFRRHMFAMRDMQSDQGRFSDVAPVGGGFGGILWGSAGVTVAWEAYQQYNDVGLLAEHYDAMAAYVDYLATTIDPETGLSSDAQLGDWLGPQNNALGSAFLATAYHVYDLGIVARAAEILDKEADAQKYRRMYEQRKAFFNSKFVTEDNRTLRLGGGRRRGFPGPGVAGRDSTPQVADTQTSYAVGLALGAFSNDKVPSVAQRLAETVRRENADDQGVTRPPYSLMTGFIGTAWISKALSDHGHSELAYRLLQNDRYPSWLYAIDQGATSIWERLNGYTIENGFGGNNSMNSFNHYSFGAVGQWMMAYSLGIQRDESHPGFKHFVLQPHHDPSGEMTWAKGHYDSMYGRISSAWAVDNGKLTYTATVPANTTATLYLPTASADSVTEGGEPATETEGVQSVRYTDGKAVYELGSGSYKFVSSL